MKTWERARAIKARAAAIIFNSEHPGQGQFRPAARRAWRKANDVQNKLAIYETKTPA